MFRPALSLISSHGLKGLNIAGIASQVGLVPSALYRHFKNKNQVIDAILDFVQERLLENVRVVTGETPDALRRLQRLLILHIQLIRENQGILRVVFSEEVMEGPEEKKPGCRTLSKPILGEVAEIVRQGQEEGVIKRDLEAGSVSVAFLGMIAACGHPLASQ